MTIGYLMVVWWIGVSGISPSPRIDIYPTAQAACADRARMSGVNEKFRADVYELRLERMGECDYVSEMQWKLCLAQTTVPRRVKGVCEPRQEYEFKWEASE